MQKKYYKYLSILLILIIGLFIYKFYSKNLEVYDKQLIGKNNTELNKNNLIKNLKYDVKFDDDTKYSITATESEITYIDNNEIVLMKIVKGIFEDKKGSTLKIESKNAIFNNNNYNTIFENNVKIDYMGNSILSDKLTLNFEENTVIIRDNIIYEGLQGLGKADNVIINLITKNIEISMNDQDDKIEITSKNLK